MKCFLLLASIGLCAALPTYPPIPIPAIDPSKSVNEQTLCYQPPLLKKICVHYKLETCEKVGLEFNMTYDGQALFNQISIDSTKAQTKICVSDIKSKLPLPVQDLLQGCDFCVELSSGWAIQATFAKFCPILDLTCKIPFAGGIPFSGTEKIPLQCLELGNPCTETTCLGCSAYSSCGWCAGVKHPVTGVPGVCMSKIPSTNKSGFSAYCEICDSGWQPQQPMCPGYVPPPSPAGAAAGVGGSTTGTDTDAGSDSTTTIIAVILGVVVVAVIGFFVYKKANAKGAMLSHDPSLNAKFSKPIQLAEDSDSISVHDSRGHGKTGYAKPPVA